MFLGAIEGTTRQQEQQQQQKQQEEEQEDEEAVPSELDVFVKLIERAQTINHDDYKSLAVTRGLFFNRLVELNHLWNFNAKSSFFIGVQGQTFKEG